MNLLQWGGTGLYLLIAAVVSVVWIYRRGRR